MQANEMELDLSNCVQSISSKAVFSALHQQSKAGSEMPNCSDTAIQAIWLSGLAKPDALLTKNVSRQTEKSK